MAERPKPITATQLSSMLERQDRRCAYTGTALTPEVASVDHIIPLGKGGGHTIGNIAIIRLDVNRAKGSMTLTEFVAMCREVIVWIDANGCPRGEKEGEENNLIDSQSLF